MPSSSQDKEPAPDNCICWARARKLICFRSTFLDEGLVGDSLFSTFLEVVRVGSSFPSSSMLSRCPASVSSEGMFLRSTILELLDQQMKCLHDPCLSDQPPWQGHVNLFAQISR